jgi:DNA-directed RNA polymerase specialized sigma24 family protein
MDRVRQFIGRKYSGHPDLEDLIQEGRIAVWRAFAAGERDMHKLTYKGMNRAGSLLQEGKPLGKPKAQRQTGYAKGEALREKLRIFIRDYSDLHGKRPTYKQMGEACGVKSDSLKDHLDKLYLYSEVAEEKPTVISYYSLFETAEESLGFFAQEPSFETNLVEKLSVQKYMTDLSEKERLALYLRFWRDLAYPAIAAELKLTNASGGEYWVKRGLKSLKVQMA